ncbi:MAG: helix-turn-helix domain-containing protein [Alphaproteobacteria bacterium]|nr:helix-turn-helix domain-containing protein [Alphaproteobacteria bacterium]NCQ89285.1 helix-turn-helix domain-containing protein [Alphaproteobacteria bacterium]NCT08149.1 helix-turn-helix domain-containing protein [Alphaproteobacteria bacterium]
MQINTIEKKAYSINEFCQLFSIGRTKTYQETKEGKLPIVKIGSRTVIKAVDADTWFQNLTG